MQRLLPWLLLPLVFAAPAPGSAANLVEDGRPLAEIVIAESPTRMQRVAAEEFRRQVEKISGARLPIVTRPGGATVRVFIGDSPDNPTNAEGLDHGAFRIVSGPDWLALVGDDRDFVPVEPWARSNADIPRAQAEWEAIVGGPYGMPTPGLYKNRLRLPGETGKPDGVPTAKNEFLEIWGLDERGSFNAVCAFFHRLGARWYLPGELGEVLPRLATLELPEIDETVRPDFALRQFNFRFGVVGAETALWMMRLGTRNDERIQIAHGLATMTNREEVFARHPDWFAVYGGKPDFRPGDSKCQLCYSNEELLRETVRWARAQLDTYGFETVSIMPPDGYTAICQCEKCRGRDTPERGERGRLSDYVWDFVNRVAREVAISHPKARVLNGAYGVYTLPPLQIEKLEPNVQVCIVGGRRPIRKDADEGEAAPEVLREAWSRKTEPPLLVFENYPFTSRGWYLPSFSAGALVDSVTLTKGQSGGEDIWLSVGSDFATSEVGFNHFLVYFTARAYWGGSDLEADAMLGEYCRLFYGPAAEEMLAFFRHGETHWSRMEEDRELVEQSLALLAKAKVAVAAGEEIHRRRLALVDNYLEGLRHKSRQLAQKRGPVPVLRLVGAAKGVVVDGDLDDDYWQRCPASATGSLRELQTGRVPTLGTTVQAGWQDGSVILAVRCEEVPGDRPWTTSTGDDDPAIWRGDLVEIEIATEGHSYYQVAVSPAGHVVDLDRGAPREQWFGWDAAAEVATRVADDHWIVEIRLPVTADENDPLHQLVGRKPTQSLPWFINVCRQRVRDDGTELSALSPTGTTGFHEPLKFAHFYDGRSHTFEADPGVTDFVIAFREAERQRRAEPFLALAGRAVSDFQKSAALEQAVRFDRDRGAAHLERIPVDPVRKAATMAHLLAGGKAPEVVARFGGEDFSRWPFWKRGDGLLLRGRAFFITKDGARAEADLTAALPWVNEPRSRDALFLALGQNREHHLGDDEAALAAYRALLGDRTTFGGADEFTALQGIARILTRRGLFDEALATLQRARPEKLQGVWKTNLTRSIAEVEAARSR